MAQQPFDPSQYPPPQGYPTAPYGPGLPPVSASDEQTWSVLAHLSVMVVSWIGPLVIYLIYKDRSAVLRHHAAEALNFHLNVFVWAMIGAVLSVVLIGLPILLVAAVMGFILPIIAAFAASRREPYRYPLTVRVIR